MANEVPAVSALKAKGNCYAREGNYIDAIQVYTRAVRVDPRDPVLYSNRSHAFLKLGQHFYALKDAETAIRLSPEWQKGYYRKGQVELDAGEYRLAIDTLNQGILINPCDDGLRRALQQAEKAAIKHKNRMASRRLKWALFFGLMATTIFNCDKYMDYNYIPTKSSWLVVFFSTILGYLTATLFYRKQNKLHPPIEVLRRMQEDLRTLKKWESEPEHSYISD